MISLYLKKPLYKWESTGYLICIQWKAIISSSLRHSRSNKSSKCTGLAKEKYVRQYELPRKMLLKLITSKFTHNTFLVFLVKVFIKFTITNVNLINTSY